MLNLRTEIEKERHFKAIEQVRSGWQQFTFQAFKKALFDMFNDGQVDQQPLVEAYEKVFGTVGTAFAEKVRAMFKQGDQQARIDKQAELAIAIQQQLTAWVALNMMDIIQAATLTTQQSIAKIIRELQQNPKISPEQFEKLLRNRYRTIAIARASTFARTETIRASNKGLLFGAAATGVPLQKVWVSVRDSRTRDETYNHIRPDGQTRDLTQPFVVSGEYLQFPAGPAGSPGNTVNCRCTISFNTY